MLQMIWRYCKCTILNIEIDENFTTVFVVLCTVIRISKSWVTVYFLIEVKTWWFWWYQWYQSNKNTRHCKRTYCNVRRTQSICDGCEAYAIHRSVDFRFSKMVSWQIEEPQLAEEFISITAPIQTHSLFSIRFVKVFNIVYGVKNLIIFFWVYTTIFAAVFVYLMQLVKCFFNTFLLVELVWIIVSRSYVSLSRFFFVAFT